MEQGYPLKKFRCDKFKITVPISNCKKTVFNYDSCKKPLKALGNRMVTMVTNKRYLINFTFFETFKDEPIPHKNFTFLGQLGYEITGGGGVVRRPLVSDVVPKPLVSEGLMSSSQIKVEHFQFCSYFSTCPSLKSGMPTLIKISF